MPELTFPLVNRLLNGENIWIRRIEIDFFWWKLWSIFELLQVLHKIRFGGRERQYFPVLEFFRNHTERKRLRS
ncbi:MAG: hypothetical protein IT165_34885 [Bryobacterales bacterium]|nr:hypothetical protein [Bryobacterales bacterium]